MTRFHLVKKVPAFHETRRFITTFTRARYLFLFSARSIQCMLPIPLVERSFSLLFSQLHRSLPSGLFPSGFPSKILFTPLLSPICATCPAHLILHDLITRIIGGELYRSLKSSLCSFLHSPVSSSLLGPNILLCTLILRSSLNVSDPVAYP